MIKGFIGTSGITEMKDRLEAEIQTPIQKNRSISWGSLVNKLLNYSPDNMVKRAKFSHFLTYRS